MGFVGHLQIEIIPFKKTLHTRKERTKNTVFDVLKVFFWTILANQ